MSVAAASVPDPEPSVWTFAQPFPVSVGPRRRFEPGAEPEATGPMWSPTAIVGYRMWRFRPHGVFGATGYRWATERITAQCRRYRDGIRHGAPHLESEGRCPARCGINAYAAPTALVRAADRRRRPGIKPSGFPLREGLYGVVSLWGRVVEHEDGYRAQHAMVIGLVHPLGAEIRSTSNPRVIGRLFRCGVAGEWERRIWPRSAAVVPTIVAEQLKEVADAART